MHNVLYPYFKFKINARINSKKFNPNDSSIILSYDRIHIHLTSIIFVTVCPQVFMTAMNNSIDFNILLIQIDVMFAYF